jgi:hypothetical protein
MTASRLHALEAELRQAAAAQGIKTTAPYVVCKRNPQGGWYMGPASDFATAESSLKNRAPLVRIFRHKEHLLC